MDQRSYQSVAITEIQQRFLKKNVRRLLVVSPTGSGKTVIAAQVIRNWGGGRVLWVAHRIELLQQAYDRLIEAGLTDVGILSGVRRVNESARVLIVSIDMFRAREVPQASFIVIDEAHRAQADSYQSVIAACPKAIVMGLTATPWRLDGQPLGETFDSMLVVAGQTELIAQGFIANPIVYAAAREKARELVKGLASQSKDFAQGPLARRMESSQLMGEIVSNWKRRAAGRATLCFAVNREHGRLLCSRFRMQQCSAEYLDGETSSDERRRILQRLMSGETKIVVNVGVLVEGFDQQSIQCVVLAAPTKSLTRFLQRCGRAARPHGNQRPIILDHARDCYRHQLPDVDREWSLNEWAKSSRTGEAPVKRCVNEDLCGTGLPCDTVMPAGCRECPECGEHQPGFDRDLVEQQAEMERVRLEAAEVERKRKIVQLLAKKENWSKSKTELLLAGVGL